MAVVRRQYGRNHGYLIDNEKVIGVTTAISKGWPKPALPHWAARTVAQRALDMSQNDWDHILSLGYDGALNNLKNTPFKQRNDAAVRGTNVHRLAEKVIEGEAVAVPDHLYGHVESVVNFLDEWQIRPVLTERVIGSYRWRYAGTFDLIADLPDGRRVLFDYKTSNSIYGDVALQLAAYRWADMYVADDALEMPMTEVGIDEAKVVHIRADGYDVIPIDTTYDVFITFLHVLEVARAADKADAWRGDAELPPAQKEIAA